MSLKTALQLYSVRDEMEEDFFKTLTLVKEMGYDGVEFAGLFDKEPAVIRDFLKELDLIPISAHVPLQDLTDDIDKVIADYSEIGCKFIAVPYLTEELRPGTDGFSKVIEDIRAVGEKTKAAGIQLLYHNHDFEFVKIGEEYGLDVLYASTAPEQLATELDTCWVNVGGADPADYITKYSGRAAVVHLKDFYMKSRDKGGKLYELIGIQGDGETAEEENFTFMPVGCGMQDMPKIIEACKNAGTDWVVVEQDRPDRGRTPLEDAKISIDNLKAIL